jgi:hypothetical protein
LYGAKSVWRTSSAGSCAGQRRTASGGGTKPTLASRKARRASATDGSVASVHAKAGSG